MKKIIAFLFMFFIITTICINSYAKYVFERSLMVSDIKIDETKPKIEFISATSDNEGYNNYANQTHTVTVKLVATEKNLEENNFTKKSIWMVGDKEISNIKKVHSSHYRNTLSIEATLSGIKGDGKLILKIPEGTIVDKYGKTNDEMVIDTGIIIDNTAPVISFTQEEIEDGKINAILKSNEKIRPINAWNISEENTKLNKEFSCNVLYPLPITDYAENTSNVDVRIDKATNMKMKFSVISGRNIWDIATEPNQILGKDFIEESTKYRIEGMAICCNDILKDKLEYKCYMNTNLKTDFGIWYDYETRYYQGYNPPGGEFKLYKDTYGLNFFGEQGIVFGASLINKKDELGKTKAPYGITALAFRLKELPEYSIVYQVWVEGNGWVEPALDGEETKLAYDKPIGLFRIALIPKTERQYLIDDWKKDVGTNNMK